MLKKPASCMIGAYKLCAETGIDNSYIALGIAAALLFEREGEEKMEPEYILTGISGFSKDSCDYKKIMRYYELLKNKESLKNVIAYIKEETQKNSKQA